jgi:membrane-bound lytic murein transglycosylase MltF
MGRLIALLFFIPALALAQPTTQFDRHFKASTATFMPAVDWRLLKAQCYQESRLRPLAKSPVGAMGVCQFMPGTWNEARTELRFAREASAYEPELSIQAASWYMGRLRRVWSAPRPEKDRHSLALASYNAGTGNLLAAQRACKNPALYEPIVVCLPQITGRYAAETLHYVPAIWGFYDRFVYGLP